MPKNSPIPLNLPNDIPRVGRRVRIAPKKYRRYNYRAAKKFADSKGWIPSCSYLPEELDLVLLQTINEGNQYGWLAGEHWYGRKLKNNMKITKWKQIPESICH